jgi:hypothetical protein
MERNKESVIEFLKNLDNESLVNLSNEFSQNNSFFDNEIYINDEDFFITFFNEKNLWNLAQMISYGNYHTNENFVKFDGYGNLESFNYPADYIEFDLIAESVLNDSFDISNYL